MLQYINKDICFFIRTPYRSINQNKWFSYSTYFDNNKQKHQLTNTGVLVNALVLIYADKY